MANFSLKLKADFDEAIADFKKLESVSAEAAAKIQRFTDGFKTEQIDKFIAKNKLNATAIKATQGPLAALQAETKGLEREIQRLIKSGLSPEDASVKRLQADYMKLSAEMGKNSTLAGNATALYSKLSIAALSFAGAMGTIVGAYRLFLKPAMDAEEAASKFNTIFGDQAGAVRSWADTYGEQIGRSSRVLQGFSADMMAIISPLGVTREAAINMSQGLSEAAQDIASFHNVDVSEAFNALRAGITGETEPLKRFSILLTDAAMKEYALSQGIRKKISEMSVSEKTTLRYNMILASMGHAQDDATRTANSTTNQLRKFQDQIADLQVAIGSNLIPALSATLSLFMDNDSVINRFNKANQEAGDRVLEVAAALAQMAWREASERASNAADSFSFVGTVLDTISEKFKTLAERTGKWIADSGAISGFQTIFNGIGEGVEFIREQASRVDLSDVVSGQFIIDANNAAAAVGDINANMNDTPQAAARARAGLDTISDGFNVMRSAANRSLQAVLNTLTVAGGASQTQIATNRNVSASYRARADAVKTMANRTNEIEIAANEMSLENLSNFMVERAEREGENAEERLQIIQDQAEAINKISFDSADARVQYERAANDAISAERTKNFHRAAQAGSQMLAGTASLFQSLLQIMQNAGKSSYAMAVTLKTISAAEALVNSYLAFTQVLADKTIWPTWARIPIASVILAAGIAKATAIATTPIPSGQTGLDYTVPDTPAMRNDRAPVMASAGENVQITPRGEEPSGSGDTVVNIDVGENNLFRIIQRGINTGKIDISRRNVGRGVFAT